MNVDFLNHHSLCGVIGQPTKISFMPMMDGIQGG